MLGALCAVAAEYGLSPQVIGGEANFTPYRLHGPRLAIAPQLHIGKRRVDLLVVRLHPWVDYGIAVECDGAAFHGPGTEKHDRAREAEIIREFQAEYAGNTRPTKPTSDRVRFMRFAGRAIWADAFACAEAVILALGE
jgi:hypothetical protein